MWSFVAGLNKGQGLSRCWSRFFHGFLPKHPTLSSLSHILLTLTPRSLPFTLSACVLCVHFFLLCLRKRCKCHRKVTSRTHLKADQHQPQTWFSILQHTTIKYLRNYAILFHINAHVELDFWSCAFPTTSFLSWAFVETSICFCTDMQIYMRNRKVNKRGKKRNRRMSVAFSDAWCTTCNFNPCTIIQPVPPRVFSSRSVWLTGLISTAHSLSKHR